MAIDPDGSRISVAKNAYSHLTNLTFAKGSSDTILEFGKACYNAVFSNHVLHWVDNKSGTFKKIYESLKPGGRVAIQCGCRGPRPLFNQTVKTLNPAENYRKIFEMLFFVEKEALEEYYREAGFIILGSEETTLVAPQKDLAHYLPVASAISHGVFDLDLIDEDKLKIFETPIDKDGQILDEYPVATLFKTKPAVCNNNNNNTFSS